jgi:hypothetical protein
MVVKIAVDFTDNIFAQRQQPRLVEFGVPNKEGSFTRIIVLNLKTQQFPVSESGSKQQHDYQPEEFWAQGRIRVSLQTPALVEEPLYLEYRKDVGSDRLMAAGEGRIIRHKAVRLGTPTIQTKIADGSHPQTSGTRA